MNENGRRIIQGTYAARGPGLALGLALISIFIPLPFFILAVVILGLTIVEFRASPGPASLAPVLFFREPSPRSPPA